MTDSWTIRYEEEALRQRANIEHRNAVKAAAVERQRLLESWNSSAPESWSYTKHAEKVARQAVLYSVETLSKPTHRQTWDEWRGYSAIKENPTFQDFVDAGADTLDDFYDSTAGDAVVSTDDYDVAFGLGESQARREAEDNIRESLPFLLELAQKLGHNFTPESAINAFVWEVLGQ